MSAAMRRQRSAVIAHSDPFHRRLLAEATAGLGLEPYVYDNGAEALAAALSADVALVLLDEAAAGMDGYSVCSRLRTEAHLTLIPLVLLTKQDDASAIGRAFDAGATDFISTPINWGLLSRRLSYILRNAAIAERIERLAYFDPLTGLPNRQRCIETAERLFAEAARCDESVAVVYMDLNSFKRINDTFGHSAGDAVLQTVAGRLVGLIQSERGHVSVARFGGDEFVILLRDCAAKARALDMVERCCKIFQDPILYDGLEFHTAPSIGIAVYPDDGTNITDVLKHADTAMYQAKQQDFAPAVMVYEPVMSSRLRDWLDLETRLRHAVQQQRLELQFQPKFSLADGRVAGVEALLRWRDEVHGEIPPTRFVQIAEDSGLIIDIGSFVVRRVCRQLREWIECGVSVPVAINISGKELLHGDPARLIESEAAAAGIPAEMIEVEITESLLVKDSAVVRGALERLRQLGCRIALDDFGTGYSSLAYITRLPPDRIKIDKAFVHHVDRSPSDAAIAATILALGQSLGIVVTAEGIERPAQLEWLRARGCHEAQGFLLSRPLSAHELEQRFLASRFNWTDELPVLSHAKLA
jgi:diguanylate cyclase (GGDEF)-like protein